MYKAFHSHISSQLEEIRAAGTYKRERVIVTPQGTMIRVSDGKPVLNLCANNYLGLAQHPAVAATAKEALDKWGYGMASVRFICGTQSVHKQLEAKLSEFLGTEDTILYGSCFDANGGLFETLLAPEDAIISDELNHASIIDGVRLCKAQRARYANNNMEDLEVKLREASKARLKMIATDGVFSMDGYIANLPAICDLAERHEALVMVDDSHAVGFMGKAGRGNIFFRTRSLQLLPARRSKCSSCSPNPPNCAIASKPIPNSFVPKWPNWASTFCPERTPLRPSCSEMPPWPPSLPMGCWRVAFTSSVFPIPSCRKAKPASARKFPPLIRVKIWNKPLRHLQK